jgi:diguanylate cyclase (GGDEF)-like protein
MRGAFVLSFFASAFILISGVKTFPRDTLIFLIYINLLPFAVEKYKKDFYKHKQVMRGKFRDITDVYNRVSEKDNRRIEANIEKEKKARLVLSLYEISKDMSACLLFEDIFNIFCASLKKSFRFRSARIVLLDKAKNIKTVYRIEMGSMINKTGPDNFDRELTAISLSTGKPVSISAYEDSDFLKRLSVIKNFETLISMPLFADEKIAAVMYVENLPAIYFENFMVLSRQFEIHFKKAALYEKIQELSITDSLTGVNTRRYLLDRCSEEMRRALRHKTNLSLLMLDIDHFKETNDRFGHLVGDAVLREVANVLHLSLREIDIIGRYGGEEFLIVLTGIGRDGAFQVAERIRKNIESAVFKAYDEVVTSTVSMGISVFPDNGIDMDSLFESADKALYKAKGSGRNRVC